MNLSEASAELKHSRGVISLLTVFFLLSTIFIVVKPVWTRANYLFLSASFAQGKVYVGSLDPRGIYVGNSGAPDDIVHGDLSYYQGKLYYPLGPMPAILYLPFISLIERFNFWEFQPISVIFFNLINIWLAFKLGRALKLSVNESLWVTFAFIFCSAYTGVAFFTHASYISHVMATTWLLASLYEFFSRRRYWLAGLLMGFALATRVTAGLGIIFFFGYIVHNHVPDKGSVSPADRTRRAIRELFSLLAPFASVLGLLFLYNYVRFQNILETGYGHSMLGGVLKDLADQGLFSIAHVSRNLYFSLLALPVLATDSQGHVHFPYIRSNLTGMSMLVTSPFLVTLVFSKLKNAMQYLLAGTAILIYIPLLFFLSTGENQYGYRFFLDFAPFLYVMMMMGIAERRIRLDWPLKTIILLSGIFDLYLVLFATFPILVKF